MSQNAKGIVELELRSDRFTQGAKAASTNLKKLGSDGKASLDALGRSSKETGRGFTQMGQQSKAAFTAMNQEAKTATTAVQQLGNQGRAAFSGVGNAAATTTTQVKQTTAELNNARIATVGMVTSTVALGASVAALTASITGMNSALSAIDKADVALAMIEESIRVQTIELTKAQDALSSSRSSGAKSAAEMVAMEQNVLAKSNALTIAHADQKTKIDDLTLAQENYNNSVISFVTSVATTSLTAVAALTMALSSNATAAGITTGEYTRLRLAALANSRALKILRVDLAGAKSGFVQMRMELAMSRASFRGASLSVHGFKASLHGARFALMGLRTGLRATYVALGPIGWAIIGISLAYEALTSNIFGVTDAIEDFLKWLEELFPILNGLSTIFRTLFPDMEAEVESVNGATQEYVGTVDELGGSFHTVGNEAAAFGASIQGAGSSMTSLNAETKLVVSSMTEYGEVIDASKGRMAEAEAEMTVFLGKIHAEVRNAAGDQATLNLIISETTDEYLRLYDRIHEGDPIRAKMLNDIDKEIIGRDRVIERTKKQADGYRDLNEQKKSLGELRAESKRLLDEDIAALTANKQEQRINAYYWQNNMFYRKHLEEQMLDDLRQRSKISAEAELARIRGIFDYAQGRIVDQVLAAREEGRRLGDQKLINTPFYTRGTNAAQQAIEDYQRRSNVNYNRPEFAGYSNYNKAGFATGTKSGPNITPMHIRNFVSLQNERDKAAHRARERARWGGRPRPRTKSARRRVRAQQRRERYKKARQARIDRTRPELRGFLQDIPEQRYFGRGYVEGIKQYYRRRHYRSAIESIAQLNQFYVAPDFETEAWRRGGLSRDGFGNAPTGYSYRTNNNNSSIRTSARWGRVWRGPSISEALAAAAARSREIGSAYYQILRNDNADYNQVLENARLTRDQLYGYKQSDQHLVDLQGRLGFYDRIGVEATLV